MVLDTSAVMAVLAAEPSAGRLIAAIEADRVRLISAATVVEVSLVLLGRYGEGGDLLFDQFLQRIEAEVVPVDAHQVALARDATRRFGRGRHAAALNYGDCFSYALAAARREPLLCVGDDFRRTNLVVV